MSAPDKQRRVPKEEAPTLNSEERGKLWMIHRRIIWLEHRIENHTGNPSHDLAELAAQRWLLERADLPEPVGQGPSWRVSAPRRVAA